MKVTFRKVKDGNWANIANEGEIECRANQTTFATLVMVGDKWHVRLQVPQEKTTEDPRCWKWTRLVKTFPALDDAKSFVKKNKEKIFELLATHIRRQIYAGLS